MHLLARESRHVCLNLGGLTQYAEHLKNGAPDGGGASSICVLRHCRTFAPMSFKEDAFVKFPLCPFNEYFSRAPRQSPCTSAVVLHLCGGFATPKLRLHLDLGEKQLWRRISNGGHGHEGRQPVGKRSMDTVGSAMHVVCSFPPGGLGVPLTGHQFAGSAKLVWSRRWVDDGRDQAPLPRSRMPRAMCTPRRLQPMPSLSGVPIATDPLSLISSAAPARLGPRFSRLAFAMLQTLRPYARHCLFTASEGRR